MQFALLGPVEVLADGERLDVGPPKQRTVLAVLLLDAGRVVPTDLLVDRVWGQTPPAAARNALYAYVSRLKQVLDAAGAGRAPVTRQSGGYRLDVDPDAVDVHVFRRLAAGALDGGDDPAGAAGRLDRAVSLWRGPALADLDGDWVAQVRYALEAQRLTVTTRWALAHLELGHHDLVVDELTAAVSEHPLVEPLAAALVRALHGAGRTAQALETYDRVRRRLVDEVGAEPGRELRAAHAAVLHDDLAGPATGRDDGAAGWSGPAQLPAGPSAFTGRDDELAELDRLVLPGPGEPGPPAGEPTPTVVAAITGTAGVGKTALAIRWAHRVRPSFPDGQLYVDLRGYGPDRPLTATEALVGLLTALGVPSGSLPADVEGLAARYRTEVSGRRMLVLLDNASSVEQIRPLLPGSPTCAVVVTSRSSLPGLVARDGAHRLELDLLPETDALALLRRLVGPPVVDDPETARRMVDRCARLPLALRLAAELAVSRPNAPLSALLAELGDHRRLDALDAGGDPRADVRAVFSWSLSQLPPDAGRAFCLLGLFPGPDLDEYAAAALTGSTLEAAQRVLGLLARAHLLQRTATGRYTMHDLLRAYAADRAAALPAAEGGKEPEGAAHAAVGRLLDHYLTTAAAAVDLIHPAESHRRPPTPPARTPAPRHGDAASAGAWLDGERASLVAATVHSATNGWHAHATGLSAVLFRYLDGGHFQDALTVHRHARDAARRSGDVAAQAQALQALGLVQWRVGAIGPGEEQLQEALALFRRAADLQGQARALASLGAIRAQLGNHGDATALLEQAIGLYRQVGDRTGEARGLGNLGILFDRLGRYEDAAAQHARALAVFRSTGDKVGEAVSLNQLGEVEAALGRHEDAARHQQAAIRIARELGDRSGEAWATNSLGQASTARGLPAQALPQHQAALAAFRLIGEREGEATALNGLGEAAFDLGEPEVAVTHHAAAVEVATAIREPRQEARGHAGLARAHHAQGRLDRATWHWQRSLHGYESMHAPEAHRVRQDALAALGPERLASTEPA